MNRVSACFICLALHGAAYRGALAQTSHPRAHSASAARHGGGYLGVGVMEIDEERAKALKLKDESGVELKNVEPGSPAAKAGLQKSDVVLEFNGHKIEDVDDFVTVVRETPPDRRVTLKIVRNSTLQSVAVTMGSHPARSLGGMGPSGNGAWNFEIPEVPEVPESPEIPEAPETPEVPDFPSIPDMGDFHIDIPRPLLTWRQASIGVEAESLNSQLAEYFGVKNGVLIRSVSKGSVAERAGIKAGDVITKVASTLVGSPQDLSRRLQIAETQKVAVVVMRNRREMTFTVVPTRRWSSNPRTPGGL